jgi:hypothetical protein
MMDATRTALAGFFVGLALAPGHAQCVIEENQPIIGSDTAAGDQFGSSVAISGDLAVVGAPFDATERGSVYVFRLENGVWVQEQKLMALDPDTFGHFGASVDLDGDTLIVGAPDNDFFVGRLFVEDAGEADVFRRVSPGDWVHEATLQASNAAEMREFGQSVALEGDRAIVGADRAFPVITDPSSGLAYVFSRDDSRWTEETILTPSSGDHEDDFGATVALSGDTIAVCASLDDNVYGNAHGTVYVFALIGNRWKEEGALISPDGSEIGRPIALDGEILAVPGFDLPGCPPPIRCRRVFVFLRSDGIWTLQQTLLPVQEDSPFDTFGIPCALDNRRLLIGGRLLDAFDDGVGHLFLDHDGLWVYSASFPITSPDSNFAGQSPSLGIDGAQAVMGAPESDQNGNDSGAVHIIDVDIHFADFNCDDMVDGTDLGKLLLAWGACPVLQSCASDLNADGLTDGADLGQLLLNWTPDK